MLSVKNGVWAKDGNNFVYVRRITDDAQLEDIYIYTFDDQRNLTHLKHANQAQYSAEIINGSYAKSIIQQYQKSKLPRQTV